MQDNILQNKKRRKKRKSNENGILFGSIVLCVVTLMAITICLVTVFRYRAAKLENIAVMNELDDLREKEAVTYTQDQVDALIDSAVEEAVARTGDEVSKEFLNKLKELMLSGDGATAMLRYFYPDEIVVADAGQYYFFPITDELKHNTYDPEQLVSDDDMNMAYYENGEKVSHKGIDVSRYQGEIDWDRVAADDVEYAFIRLGIRGYTKGEIQEDETFEDNIKGAEKNGIGIGVYFFTQATSIAEAEEEARYVLDMIEPYKVDYPVVIDVEAVNSNNARTAELTREERTQYCIAFCEMIREAGYTPMIYGNLKTFMLMLDLEQLEEYDKWFAYYDKEFYYPYDFKIWQYTDTGKVDGIGTEVDLNISFDNLSGE